jgi:D-lyxose ketol-isomerase
MITRTQQKIHREQAAAYISESGFPVTSQEMNGIAVADFGLSSPHTEGAQILTLFATERISAKLIVLLPDQVLPEHWHPPVGDDPGKEEILRGYAGTVLYYEEGTENIDDTEVIPGKEECYVSRSRIDLEPGVQVIIPPGKKHWMKGGPNGGCVISFSTCVRDILDQFTDRNIIRTTQIVEG